MRTTIDKAGRVVIPKALRDRVGLGAGEVEVYEDGNGLRVEAVSGSTVVERDGRWVIPGTGRTITVEDVREMRLGDQR